MQSLHEGIAFLQIPILSVLWFSHGRGRGPKRKGASLMKIKKVFCLFEQSGTFKNAFKNLGIDAEDYDILNDFGQTDHITDLFAEIDKAYMGEPSLFDEIGPDDLCFAFFPCTRFECQIQMSFCGHSSQQKKWSDAKKLDYSMRLHEELHRLYILICELFQISLRGGGGL